jgi:hypothetical protein
MFFDSNFQNQVVQHDATLIKEFLRNPDSTALVSFPRTGSHWLRFLMELYFNQPLLTRSFYHKLAENPSDFLLYHTHDLNLEFNHETVLYLYRQPVEVIYSQLRYHGQIASDNVEEYFFYWLEKYTAHLEKWIIEEHNTKKKLVIRYKDLRSNATKLFRKICEFYNQPFNPNIFQKIYDFVSKKEVNSKTQHDKQVVKINLEYAISREGFETRYSDLLRNWLDANFALDFEELFE